MIDKTNIENGVRFIVNQYLSSNDKTLPDYNQVAKKKRI